MYDPQPQILAEQQGLCSASSKQLTTGQLFGAGFPGPQTPRVQSRPQVAGVQFSEAENENGEAAVTSFPPTGPRPQARSEEITGSSCHAEFPPPQVARHSSVCLRGQGLSPG